MKNPEIKVLNLEKGDGVALIINRDGERGVNRINLKFEEIQPVIRLLVAKLKGQDIVEGELYAHSGFGSNTRQPFVELSHGITWSVQVSPQEAREFGASVLEAAEAAETDAFLFNFFQQIVGVKTDEEMYGIINDFRRFREDERERNKEENR